MKRVIEHREDRFSPSLHLVDADSGTRFSDETVAAAKGVLMQSTEAHKGATSEERIAEIRALRHAAVRRRRAIAVSLLTITVVVLVCAFALHFSPLFALIPPRCWPRCSRWVCVRQAGRGVGAEGRQIPCQGEEACRRRTQTCAGGAGGTCQTARAGAGRGRKVADEQLKTDVVPEGEIRQGDRPAARPIGTPR